ncbi:MAG: hypothetical protein ACTSXO_09780 [Candidatus Heimdallarchaeota archaeon]|nr:MAG: hypothetical protein DRO63_05995 [Candidatus Gerdarchaeota archaeon]RLI69859.1 MAG: hypothetical protein DRP02_09565 [Candidatus Gerdarchaeota archaeon]RLI72353.1 MAG: hypothetical protein DRO91_04590 [Candidatus Heimdallarchaeota archaeon]
MTSPEKEDRTKTLFESRFLSIILMISLLLMCAIFLVVTWQLFGSAYTVRVGIALSAGAGGGIILTFILLLVIKSKKTSRNILLYLVIGLLFGSLVVSLILKFAIPDPTKSVWAFIEASSVGLGITASIAFTYLLLAIFRSKLIFEPETSDAQEEIQPEELSGEEKKAELSIKGSMKKNIETE